jgi:hypothetical protein
MPLFGFLNKSRKAAKSQRRTVKKRSSACPPGQVTRSEYQRRYKTAVREKGYLVRRGGKTVRVFPKKLNSTHVKQACIKDPGLPASLAPGERIGPLRQGELKKYGYVYRLSDDVRHESLKKAVAAYGALSVYRKLDAVAKLSVHRLPSASRIFKRDREWVKRTYGKGGHLHKS